MGVFCLHQTQVDYLLQHKTKNETYCRSPTECHILYVTYCSVSEVVLEFKVKLSKINVKDLIEDQQYESSPVNYIYLFLFSCQHCTRIRHNFSNKP